MRKTLAAYERHLNQLYADIYSPNEAVDSFCYLKDGKIKESTILTAHTNHTLGTLLRRWDPISFRLGFNDWDN